jgi:thiol-disulfide isomerase/thioredoxin
MKALPFLALSLLPVLAGCGSDPKSAGAPDAAALAGSPPPLAAVHKEGNQLLGGGGGGFEERIAQLKGFPVVVNKWASWCGPCRAEFPLFQKESQRLGRKVAFLGVDGNDNDGDAKEFLARYPVSYPSYKDPDGKIAQVFHATVAFPSTAFYDRTGKLSYVKQGGYDSQQKLAADIDRYTR